MHKHVLFYTLAATAVAALLTTSLFAVDMEFVTVADPNNPADTVAFNAGSVSYAYEIGKYEVTAGQYVEFLNAKAADTDPYGLYNPAMADGSAGMLPCGIIQENDFFTYTYHLSDSSWENKPVNYVDFWDCIRFANWMHNGQNDGDTETGSYTITSDGITNNTIVRNPDATYVVASNDEWHKAAYYDSSQQYYYQYATSSDDAPVHDIVDPDPGNNASIFDGDAADGITVVGEFENSDSPYGTFDQMGNVREWTDTIEWEDGRIIRDGPWNFYPSAGAKNTLLQFYPQSIAADNNGLGFRLVRLGNVQPVPVPGDTNNDYVVDELDAQTLAENWGKSVTEGANVGDFNDDDMVNALDAAILAANWSGSTEATASAAPEPSSVILLLTCLMAMLAVRRAR